MFGRKKEKEVKKLILEHLEFVEKAVQNMVSSAKEYIGGDLTAAKEHGYQTHLVEKDADQKRREIIEKLHKGAFIPAFREDLIKFIAQQDKIADRAESCCDFFLTQRPEIPDKFNDEFEKLLLASARTFSPYKMAITNMFSDYNVVKEKIRDVNTEEEETDTIEWHLTRDVFSSDITLAEKMHLREFIFHIVEISDTIEDAADDLDIVIVKYRM
ncbi:MAG: TIGR00153 family protein [Elusimicrobia bacterium]|nr:TIGR00153 family protein [Elusimicrobiota bacterium]